MLKCCSWIIGKELRLLLFIVGVVKEKGLVTLRLGAIESVFDLRLSSSLLVSNSTFIFVFEISSSSQVDFTTNAAEEGLEPRLD